MGLSAHLPEAGLIAITWIGVILTTVFVAARTAIRIKKMQIIAIDDYFIYAAYFFLIVNAILQTLQTPHAYQVAYGVDGLVPIDAEFVRHGTLYLKFEFAIIGLFWTVLWLVKASFLAFFYPLFDGIGTYRKLWWALAVFSFLAYAGCWIASILNCHPASNYFIFGACNKPIDLRGSVIAISYSTAVDVLTDVMIMALPISLIRNVKITARQRYGLMGIFSVGFIIIIFAIVRWTQITFTARTDSILLSLWGILESSISVVVGCLPPFKSLFGRPGQSSAGYSGNGYERYGTSNSRGNAIPLAYHRSEHTTNVKGGTGAWDADSTEEIITQTHENERKDIHVRNDVTIESH